MSVLADDGVQPALILQASVGQHHRHAPLVLHPDQELVIPSGRVDDQAVHPVFEETLNGPLFPQGVLLAVGKEDLIPGALTGLGDALQQQSRKRARDVADAAADQHTAAGLEPLSGPVRAIVELCDHLLDTLAGFRRDILVFVIQVAGNRRF